MIVMMRDRAWRTQQARHRSRGQALVEFALVFPVFVLMLFGLIDMGRYVYFSSTLSQAAREGARLASVEASWLGSADPSCGTAGGPVCPANVAALRDHVQVAANRMMAPFAPVAVSSVYLNCSDAAPTGNWTTATCGSPYPGALVSVRIVSQFNVITPMVSQIVGSLAGSASATMVSN
jgi:Flp pilus assembly protein TadG